MGTEIDIEKIRKKWRMKNNTKNACKFILQPWEDLETKNVLVSRSNRGNYDVTRMSMKQVRKVYFEELLGETRTGNETHVRNNKL